MVHRRREPYDDNGHGTHISGIIGGSGTSSDGRYQGVAPECHIIMVKVLDQKGSKPVTVQIHYLKPICWEEYGNLKTTELAALVKERIAQAIQAHTGKES